VIANIANIFLWIKEHSPQACDFTPYRLVGKSSVPGEIVQQVPYPYTAIARSNACLIMHSLGLLGSNPDVKVALNGDAKMFTAVCSQVMDIYKLKVGQRPKSPAFSKYISYEEFKEVLFY
jgi:hypothetical protein